MQHLAKSRLKNSTASKNVIPCIATTVRSQTLLTTPLAITHRHRTWQSPRLSCQTVDEQETEDSKEMEEQTPQQESPNTRDSDEEWHDAMEKNVQQLAEKTDLVIHLQIQISNLEESISDMKLEIVDLREQLRNSKEKSSKYLDKINDVTTETERLQQENEMRKIALEKAKNTIQELEQNVESEQLEQRLLQARLAALSMERDNHLQQIHRAVERAEKEEKELREKFNKDLEGLKKCNTEREQHMMEDCEWKLREIEKNYKSKLECQKKLQQEETTKQIQELEWKFNSQQEHFNSERQKLMKELKEIEKQLAVQIKGSEAEINQLRGFTQELQKGMKDAELEMEEMRATEKQLKQQLKVAKDQSNDGKLVVSKLQNEICELKDRHETIILRLDRKCRRDIEDAKTQTAEIWKEKLRQENSRLQCYLQNEYEDEKQFSLETLQTKKNAEIQEMKEEFKEKEQEYFSEVKRLQVKIEDYQMKYRDLKDTHEKAMEETQKLRLDIIEKEEIFKKEIQNLHDESLKGEDKVSQLPNVSNLQKQLQQLSLRQKEIDFNIKNNDTKDELTQNDVQLKEEKIKILEEMNGVLKSLLRTVCIQVDKNLRSAEKKEEANEVRITQLENHIETLQSHMHRFTQNLSASEKISLLVETKNSSFKSSHCLNSWLLFPMLVILCSTCIAFAVTFLLLSLLLPALLPYIPL